MMLFHMLPRHYLGILKGDLLYQRDTLVRSPSQEKVIVGQGTRECHSAVVILYSAMAFITQLHITFYTTQAKVRVIPISNMTVWHSGNT